MKIKTHLYEIEIKSTDFFAKEIKENRVMEIGSEIMKVILNDLPINKIKVEYTEEEKNGQK